jgi:hypothetical protein
VPFLPSVDPFIPQASSLVVVPQDAFHLVTGHDDPRATDVTRAGVRPEPLVETVVLAGGDVGAAGSIEGLCPTSP